jgi:hypothetical protein
MSVQAFKVYYKAKQYISGTISLGSTTFDAHLMQSASNFATNTLSTYGSLTSQVASGNNYKQSGKALTSVTWALLTSTVKFNSAAFTWTATGGTIPNIKALVLVARTGASGKASTNKLLCYCSLSSGQFTLSQNNTLTITPNAAGIFTLV